MEILSHCRLCHGPVNDFYRSTKPFIACYEHCLRCDLVQTEKSALPSLAREKHEYQMHNNHIMDDGYVGFLSRILDPMEEFVAKEKDVGLDWGSGPYPMLVKLAMLRGMRMDHYDPIFAPDGERLGKDYDFIMTTEVVEHFHNPHTSWKEMLSHLKNNGKLAVMTQLRREEHEFKNWYYRQDCTHVAFYSEKTMSWIAQNLQLKILKIKQNVVIFEKLNNCPL